MKRRSLSFISLLVLVSTCHAQSPYSYPKKQEVLFVGCALGLSVVGMTVKASQNASVNEDNLHLYTPDKINAFDRGATSNFNTSASSISDLLRNGTIILPALFLIPKNTRKDILKLALLTFEVVATNYGVTTSTKYSVQRARPYVYNETLSTSFRTNNQSKSSFYSGHASHTAAVSVMIAKVFTDYNANMSQGIKVLLWTGAIAYPITTGALRVISGDHFPTDVITGTILGGVIGYLIPHYHKNNSTISLSPYKLDDAHGITINLGF